ncbi:unnamed protein product [Brachionus calyciflorus]|uniref:Transmembrane protein n=1 Tax=Brachionus calyciflorus TaxID=104777 RepID=A0A813M8H7_9BILA|nr:unnamed protein product [Brachionus calyciflorus]
MIKILIAFCLIIKQNIECVRCLYYPNYPSQSLILTTVCTYGCKLNATTASSACLYYEAQDLWWISFPIIILIGIAFFILTICNKNKLKCSRPGSCSSPKCPSCPSCPKFRLPKFRKTRNVEQSHNTIDRNLQSNNQDSRIATFQNDNINVKIDVNINGINHQRQIDTPPPNYKDLVVAELTDSAYIAPEIDFPLPVLPESVDQQTINKK